MKSKVNVQCQRLVRNNLIRKGKKKKKQHKILFNFYCKKGV